MKFHISFKDPDVVHDAIREAVSSEVDAMPTLSSDEKDAIVECRIGKVDKWVSRWFRYGEYIDVECDTEADTVTVIKQS